MRPPTNGGREDTRRAGSRVLIPGLSPRIALCLLVGVGLLVPTLLQTAPPDGDQAAEGAGVAATSLSFAGAGAAGAVGSSAAASAAAAALEAAVALASAEDHVVVASLAGRDRSRNGRGERAAAERRADPAPMARDEALRRALELLDQVSLIDGHNDLPWKLRELAAGDLQVIELGEAPEALALQTDLNRMRRGRLGAQFWSAFVPPELPPQEAVVQTFEQVDLILRLVQRHPGALELATSASDIERVFEEGRIASLIGVEGGHSLGDGSLAVLRQLHRLGVRYLTLTHNESTPWADAATGQVRCGGLSPEGVAIVQQMNKLGMLVDLSHTSISTMHDAIDASAAPVIFSHSAARALVDHPRNVPDEVLTRLWDNGGIVMVTFVGAFVSPEAKAWWREREGRESDLGAGPGAGHEQAQAVKAAMTSWLEDHPQPRATVAQVADHIAHVARVAGVEHVGIGSDFDGMSQGPAGLEDVSCLPNLVAELLRRGFTEQEVRGIVGGNFLRVMREAERIGNGLAPRPPRMPRLQNKGRIQQHPAGKELDIDEIEELDPFTEKPFALLVPRAGAMG